MVKNENIILHNLSNIKVYLLSMIKMLTFYTLKWPIYFNCYTFLGGYKYKFITVLILK